MQDNNNLTISKIYSMLGIANKAGKLVSGEEIVRNSIRDKNVKLLIISTDASANTLKRFHNTATYYKVPYIVWGDKQQLGKCIGKSDRSVIGIIDEGFSSNINKLVNAITDQKSDSVKNAGGELFEQNENI